MMKPVASVAITETHARGVLETWLKHRNLRMFREDFVVRLDGLNYWAFVGYVDWYRKYSTQTGIWGFNVHDDGEITAMRINDE